MIQRNPVLALILTTLVGIGIIIALYLSLTDPGPPPETEEERFERVHAVLIEAFAGGAAWSGRVEILGLQSSRTAAHTPGWQINGTEGACDSSGSYIIRDRPARPLAITAPHSQSDSNTGELAQLLFEETDARAVAFNTASRTATDECGPGSDLTMDRWHPFSAFGLAFADTHRDGVVIQLHGAEGASSDAGADIVIGDGLGSSDRLNADLAACFAEALPGQKVAIGGGNNVRENAQGRVLQSGNHRRFQYLQFSKSFRRMLRYDQSIRDKIVQCLSPQTSTNQT